MFHSMKIHTVLFHFIFGMQMVVAFQFCKIIFWADLKPQKNSFHYISCCWGSESLLRNHDFIFVQNIFRWKLFANSCLTTQQLYQFYWSVFHFCQSNFASHETHKHIAKLPLAFIQIHLYAHIYKGFSFSMKRSWKMKMKDILQNGLM